MQEDKKRMKSERTRQEENKILNNKVRVILSHLFRFFLLSGHVYVGGFGFFFLSQREMRRRNRAFVCLIVYVGALAGMCRVKV